MVKEDTKVILQMFFGIIVMVFLIFWGIPNALGGIGAEGYTSECDKYTNITNGAQYMFGKCYFPEYHYYETKEVCKGGFIGIGQACYESSETHYESYTTTKCIVADTGERC
ncbi:hypothetical protein LCGC14_2724740 [marine sediment metagenome]|uniref:Uncharacterized protein n=1 Tax=marine sediment metagenome TaxID=412755 RepID=A0A0F8Z951_9ZZZZ